MERHVDIDKEFAAVVKKCGGVVLDEELPKKREFYNADFVFHQSKVIAELKRLDGDKSDDPAIKQRLGNLWERWRERGLVQGPTPPVIDSRQVPPFCQNEMVRTMGESIRGRIKKANLQIKATKSAENWPDYRGMLFLANDGNFIMEMPAMLHLIALSIKDHFHEIESVTLFSGNILSWVSGMDQPTKMWFTLQRDGTILSLTELAEKLGAEWGMHYSSITGINSVPSEVGDMEFFLRKMKSHPF
jgi:hypothetical protein